MTRLTFEEIGMAGLSDADCQRVLATLAQGLKCDKCNPWGRFKMPRKEGANEDHYTFEPRGFPT